MLRLLAAVSFLLSALPASAQEIVANDGYRTCPAEKTQEGLDVVRSACGTFNAPDFSGAYFGSLEALKEAEALRDLFIGEVHDYGLCVTDFITAQQQPGMPADSHAPDQAACAHAWAEDQLTETVREFGRACIDFSNRSMRDARIAPWDGECYPVVGSERG